MLEWIKAKDKLPPRHKYVLIATPFCKYPFCSGFWNGINWADSEKTKIENIEYWAFVELPK